MGSRSSTPFGKIEAEMLVKKLRDRTMVSNFRCKSGTTPLTNLLPDYRSEAVLELHPELSDLALGLGPHAVHPPSDHLVRPQIGLDICLLFWAYHFCITRLFSE